MRLILLISIFTLFLQAQSILVINSNSSVKKYQEAISEFSNNFNKPFEILDISTKSSNSIKETLYNEYPDVIYAVGSKAYQYANKYLPEKKIYFSSIVNWKKFPMKGKRYGVSNELHSAMQLTLIKSIFSKIKTIGVIYSKYTQDLLDDFSKNAKKLDIKIISMKVDKESIKNTTFDTLLKSSEAIMIISDTIFLNNEEAVNNLFDLSKKYKKPVFAYHELFIKHGATLVMSVDNPTIGRQIATMIESNLAGHDIEKIQYPAGTKVIFNKAIATKLGVQFSSNSSLIATEVVE